MIAVAPRMTASTISRIMRRSILVFRRTGSGCPHALVLSTAPLPVTPGLWGDDRQSIVRAGRSRWTGAGGGLAAPRLPSGSAAASPPAGDLPDKSSSLPSGCSVGLPGGSSRLGPGGRGAALVSDRPSLLQGFFPARSYCADARAFVRCKSGHTREKVRVHLPVGSVVTLGRDTGREGGGGPGLGSAAW